MRFFRLRALRFLLPLACALGIATAHAAPASTLVLSEDIHEKITALSRKGDALASQGKYATAVQIYTEALHLLPKPMNHWEAATWLWVAIGDAHLPSKNCAKAASALSEAMHCPHAIGNPFIHLT